MTTVRNKLILFVTLGFAAILLAMRMNALPAYWRGLLVMLGGWLMAVGVLYQVKLYAYDKDILYYLFIVLAGIFWICMTVITLFWFGTLLGVV